MPESAGPIDALALIPGQETPQSQLQESSSGLYPGAMTDLSSVQCTHPTDRTLARRSTLGSMRTIARHGTPPDALEVQHERPASSPGTTPHLDPLRDHYHQKMDFLDIFEQALDGDLEALASCLDGVVEAVDGQPISSIITLMPLQAAVDAERLKGRVLEAVADGSLSSVQAGPLTALLEKMRALLKKRKKSPHVLAQQDLNSPFLKPTQGSASSPWQGSNHQENQQGGCYPRTSSLHGAELAHDLQWVEGLGDCSRTRHTLEARIDQVMKGDEGALRTFLKQNESLREVFLASTRIELLSLNSSIDVDRLQGRVGQAMAQGAVSRQEGVQICAFLEQVRGRFGAPGNA